MILMWSGRCESQLVIVFVSLTSSNMSLQFEKPKVGHKVSRTSSNDEFLGSKSLARGVMVKLYSRAVKAKKQLPQLFQAGERCFN